MELFQPLVPQRLPCYDFTLVTNDYLIQGRMEAKGTVVPPSYRYELDLQ
jgi:hypothetical protein